MLAASTASLAADPSFLWIPDRGNETQIYLHVVTAAFNPPRDQVRRVFPTLPTPESDYAPLLFFSVESGKTLAEIWEMRSKAGSWEGVREKVGIGAERIVVELERDAKPPFDRTRSPRPSALNDDEIFRCVNLRALAKGLALPIDTVSARRATGMTWKAIAAERYRETAPP